ncbi:hypothetical protein Q6272_32735, partial [Klebsiella pneumoniae]|uniref:hypothetical protein n=1 Tax=Klebsiella pneumoniae TaxID=573 RepID=UPI00272F93CF
CLRSLAGTEDLTVVEDYTKKRRANAFNDGKLISLTKMADLDTNRCRAYYPKQTLIRELTMTVEWVCKHHTEAPGFE